MQVSRKISAGISGLALLLGTAAYGQSLGDVARQQREKQKQKSAIAPHKVITNDEIPEASTVPSNPPGRNEDKPGDFAVRPSGASAEQIKSAIQSMKSSIAAMQSQIDRVNSSIHFVEANRYSNGVQYNQRQVQKQDEVQRMQAQLEEQKKRLEDMQEAARKQGFGNSVYDP